MKNIIIGLLCLIISNFILDISIKKVTNEFSISFILKSLLKIFVIVSSSLLIYLSGHINPTILAVSLDGVNMNLVDALKMIYVAGIMFYGFQSIKKLSKVLSIDTSIESVTNIDEETSETYPIIEIEDEEEEPVEEIPTSDEVKG